MVLQEYHHCYRFIAKYFAIVKAEMSKMHQADPEKAKTFTNTIQHLTQRIVSRAPGAQEGAAPQQQQPALNANNLQRHAEQLAEQHRLAQKAGRMSPDGSPPIVIKPSITTEDLKLPVNRKRKPTDQPENPSPSKTRSPKPATTTATPQVTASPQPKARPAPPVEKKFRCERAGCLDAFALSNELAEHQRMHERDAERQRLEAERATFKKENPLEYSLSSIASALHLNRDGTMKASPAPGGLTPRPTGASTPQTKAGSSPLPPGSTPLRNNAMTPKAKSLSLSVRTVSGSKPVAPDGEQIPTPPTTFWDTAGSPMALHQCFEGIEDISPSNKLDSSLFTPAYTPEDSGDEKMPAISSYEDWNPFGMKDVCGSEVLQEIMWDTAGVESSVCATKEGAVWGEAGGFMMLVQ